MRVISRMRFALVLIGLSIGSAGCMKGYIKSVGGDTEKVFGQIYRADFDTTWQAVLEALKSSPLEISNREAGFIRTKWIDNTSQRNFVDSFGPGTAYLKAQFRFRVTVGKGFYNGKPSVRVNIQKEQFVQQDVLEGWRPIISDGIEEKTLIYRIGRIIFVKLKIARIEEERAERQFREEEEALRREEQGRQPVDIEEEAEQFEAEQEADQFEEEGEEEEEEEFAEDEEGEGDEEFEEESAENDEDFESEEDPDAEEVVESEEDGEEYEEASDDDVEEEDVEDFGDDEVELPAEQKEVAEVEA